jgi:hypothetical protein
LHWPKGGQGRQDKKHGPSDEVLQGVAPGPHKARENCQAMPGHHLRKFLPLCILLSVIAGLIKNLRWLGTYSLLPLSFSYGQIETPSVVPETIRKAPNATSRYHNRQPVIDIISIGTVERPQYLDTQEATFGRHPAVRNFFRITEKDDVDQGDKDCNSHLSWIDVLNISGFCGGRRSQVKTKHPFLYELRIKFANPKWLGYKKNPVAWLCAQKRPMAGFRKAVDHYNNLKVPQQQQQQLPDYLIIMDDDTYYNMEQVTQYLTSFHKQQYELYGDDRIAMAGCVIRGRIKRFKWTFPFGGWGTIFSRGALESILYPLSCNQSINNKADSFSLNICPKLQKNRIGEYELYRDGMSLFDVMYQYVMREPYVDQAHWSLGFCLHSDWVWGYMSNYYNISVALGRRRKDLSTDRLGPYMGSEINPAYSATVLQLRGQCDNDSDENCTKDAHICHYVTPQHMESLWSQQHL